MIAAIFGFSVVFLLISKKRNRNWNDPFVVFNMLWSVVGLLLLIGNESVYTPTVTAQSCILIGIIGYNLSTFSRILKVGNIHITRGTYEFNTRRAYIFSVLVLIISFYLAISAIRSFLSGVSLSEIRNEYFTYTSTESVFIYYLRDYIIEPLRYVVIVSAIFSMMRSGRKSKGLIINALLCVVLQAISNGGRYILMNTFFMIVCGSLFFFRNKKISFRQKLAILIAVGLLAYGLIFLTNDRATYLMKDMTVVDRLYTTIYEYFAGSVTYLGEVIKTTPGIKGATFGINFIAGWISPFFVMLNFLGILSYPSVFSFIGIEACKVLRIGPNLYYNAMPTAFGYFYIDGGLIITFITAWIFGYICKRLYARAENGEMLYVALYILVFLQICNMSTRWFFYSSSYCLAFIFMRFVFDKGKNEEGSNI